MKYELLIQSPDPARPYEPASVQAALATQSDAGSEVWKLKHGRVEVAPLQQDGRPIATNLRVPLSDNLDLIHEVVVQAAQVAEKSGACVFDPQLGRVVSAKDEGAVADQFFRTAQYAGMMVGVSEALGASLGPVDEGGLKSGTKVLLGIIGLLVFAYLLLDWFTSR